MYYRVVEGGSEDDGGVVGGAGKPVFGGEHENARA